MAILEQYGIVPSMSRPANPYDNASCESFMKTLKREEIYANRYDDLEQLRANIQEFIEQYYNRKRLHSALGYQSAEEFERQTAQGDSADFPGATVALVVNDGNGENRKGVLLSYPWTRTRTRGSGQPKCWEQFDTNRSVASALRSTGNGETQPGFDSQIAAREPSLP